MAAKRGLFVIGVLIGALAFPFAGFGEGQKESQSPKIDQNAELGKGHLGPQDPATKAGVSEQEHRANQSGHGQNDPSAGRGGSGKRSGGSGKSAESDFGGQSASDQGKH
jgi:hypothetical protein